MEKMMKALLTFVLLTTLFISFNVKSQNKMVNGGLTVHSVIFEDSERINTVGEFFCSMGTDTSTYSILVVEYSYIGNHIRISFNFRDLNEIQKRKLKRYYKNRTYDEIMTEFDACLGEASKFYNLNSLKEIVFYVSELGECSVETNLNYSKLLPRKLPREYYLGMFYKNVNKAIYMSGLKNRIDEIIKKYDVQVDTINFDDEHFYCKKRSEFLKQNVVTRDDIP